MVSAVNTQTDFTLHAQLVVDLATGSPTGAEVYATSGSLSGDAWHDAPVEEITAATVRTLEHLASVTHLVPDGGTVSVNVDPRCITAIGTAAIWRAVAELVNHHLVLEVLETSALAPPAVAVLAAWREAGARVVVDDFGAGFASVDRLEACDWDGVKLDRSLLAQAKADPARSSEIAAAAARYDYVVAEGIETDSDTATARSLGATHGQGWLFHRACAC
jgi:EAL domain-containing protein (putative c-di-GMP-specific phosphodiesterase class I)